MISNTKLLVLMEVIWWIITAIIIYLVLQPLLLAFHDIPYLISNIAFIFITITYLRHIFLLKYSLIAKNIPIKFLLVLASIPLAMFIVPTMQAFQQYLDNDGIEKFTLLLNNPSLSTQEVIDLLKYARAEFSFFGIAAFVSVLALPIRMLISIWKQKHKGTV